MTASDALLPADDRTRAIARELYDAVADAPIISPHGHVDPRLLLDDRAFDDPATLFIRFDHYVTRVLHAAGIPLDALGLGGPVDTRGVWRLLCDHWYRYAGTASGYWLGYELAELFGITEPLSAETADATYDRISAVLAETSFRPRALFRRFGIEVLATTDDPLDDLEAHRALAAIDLGGRVIPTFRPDAYLDPEGATFRERSQALLDATGRPGTLAGYLDGLADRRAFFVSRGAVSADHGVLEPFTVELGADDAERLFAGARRGTLDPAEARLLRGHLLLEMARMSTEDGLVMTIHPGVRRNHHQPTFERFGPDAGHDIPLRVEYTDNLRPLLHRFGTAPGLHLVLFTIDESVLSREVAPLAGFYPSVFAGAPWWFLDAPDAIQRARSAVTETAGFYRGSGFIDDTRAFLSIPARHDTSRRLDAAFLARYVVEERIPMTTARRIARDLVDAIPRTAFKL